VPLEYGDRLTHVRCTTYDLESAGISPLLSNVYLHHVFDLWVDWWRRTRAHGEVIVVRFADDFIVGFEHREEADRFLSELKERLQKFGLTLHPDKTRLLEFGRWAEADRQKRGEGKPKTFDFLGFTHVCGKTRAGRFTVKRRTMRKRAMAKLKSIREELQRRLHDPVPRTGAYLRPVLLGHYRYYGVPMNGSALETFRWDVECAWWKSPKRRSQRAAVPSEKMGRLGRRWLPRPHICHPYPLVRLGVITQGRSRMR